MEDSTDLSGMMQDMLGIHTKCGQCACNEDGDPALDVNSVCDVLEREMHDETQKAPTRPQHEKGLIAYTADVHQPLAGPPLRSGEVWHLPQDEVRSFQRATLFLHANGICIRPLSGRAPLCISWSPFSLVQACRLHTEAADAARPWMRLFKVSVFHHGITHLFAAEGRTADSERARWVADIACAVRVLTQSLFPPFRISVLPVQGAVWTATRLLAGYMLMCDSHGVSVVYCELHSHWDTVAAFVAYEDEYCDARVLHIPMGVHTNISERVGVDCSCFIIDSHHFSTRTCAEKALWLRAISNVKVKLRHSATNPTTSELANYRQAIQDSAKDMQSNHDGFTQKALLPLRVKHRQFCAPLPDTPPQKSEEQAAGGRSARRSAEFGSHTPTNVVAEGDGQPSAPPPPPTPASTTATPIVMTPSAQGGVGSWPTTPLAGTRTAGSTPRTTAQVSDAPSLEASALPPEPPSPAPSPRGRSAVGTSREIPNSQPPLPTSMAALGPVLMPPQLPMLLREASRDVGRVQLPTPSDFGFCEAMLSAKPGDAGDATPPEFHGSKASVAMPEDDGEVLTARMSGLGITSSKTVGNVHPLVAAGPQGPEFLSTVSSHPYVPGVGVSPQAVPNPSAQVLAEPARHAGETMAGMQQIPADNLPMAPPASSPRRSESSASAASTAAVPMAGSQQNVQGSAAAAWLSGGYGTLPEPSPEPAPSTGSGRVPQNHFTHGFTPKTSAEREAEQHLRDAASGTGSNVSLLLDLTQAGTASAHWFPKAGAATVSSTSGGVGVELPVVPPPPPLVGDEISRFSSSASGSESAPASSESDDEGPCSASEPERALAVHKRTRMSVPRPTAGRYLTYVCAWCRSS